MPGILSSRNIKPEELWEAKQLETFIVFRTPLTFKDRVAETLELTQDLQSPCECLVSTQHTFSLEICRNSLVATNSMESTFKRFVHGHSQPSSHENVASSDYRKEKWPLVLVPAILFLATILFNLNIESLKFII